MNYCAGEKKKITNVVCVNQLEFFAKTINETYFEITRFGKRAGRLQKQDRIRSDRIDKPRTGSDRINETWIGLCTVDIAYV